MADSARVVHIDLCADIPALPLGVCLCVCNHAWPPLFLSLQIRFENGLLLPSYTYTTHMCAHCVASIILLRLSFALFMPSSLFPALCTRGYKTNASARVSPSRPFTLGRPPRQRAAYTKPAPRSYIFAFLSRLAKPRHGATLCARMCEGILMGVLYKLRHRSAQRGRGKLHTKNNRERRHWTYMPRVQRGRVV